LGVVWCERRRRATAFALAEAVEGGGVREVITLGIADTEATDVIELVFGFDALCDDLRACVGNEHYARGSGAGFAVPVARARRRIVE
jgi:hypothetical protein